MKLQSLALPVLSLLGIGHAYVLSTDCPSDSRSSNPLNIRFSDPALSRDYITVMR